MKKFFVAAIMSSAILASVPAMACEQLPFGKDACKQMCKLVYKEGIPQTVCIWGSTPPVGN